jgi:hypothetical protein
MRKTKKHNSKQNNTRKLLSKKSNGNGNGNKMFSSVGFINSSKI